MSAAFSRSKAIFTVIGAALAAGASMQSIIANGQANYVSRGHGRSKYSGKKRGNTSGRPYPAFSERECLRRLKQMAAREA